MQKQIISTVAIVSIAGYIGAQILADIGSLKIATISLPLLGKLAIDGGTFIYPFTFTLRDMIHKNLGKTVAQKIILIAASINLLMACFFAFLVWLPADSSWGLQSQFANILGPLWQIVFASIIAELISELIDTEAYSFFVNKITSKHQWLRVLFSNAIAIPIDSTIFAFIAFYGQLPVAVIWAIILTNILVKSAVTLISLPMIYLVKERSAN
ncbi:queuosine precursor transporter [Candidatus Saccharibacteria bacterium]|nr:queuosine precursor transporter [Candidatus Saccharibacteria bacterium]